MIKQIGGKHGLVKLHLENRFKMRAEETHSKSCVRPHTQICPLLTPSAKIGGDAKSQQAQQ